MGKSLIRGGVVMLAMTVLAGAASGPALAQADAVERCRQMPDAASQIACLEAALTAPADTRAVPAAPAAPRAPAMPEAPAAPAAAEADDGGNFITGLDAGRALARLRRGEEGRQDREDARISVAVASFREIPYRRLEVTLDNGQVWRQMQGDNQRVAGRLRRGQAYTADVWEGALGNFRLRINEIERIVQVERVR
ncbi:hypothetical protein [Maricaulis sp. CAU 1757]